MPDREKVIQAMEWCQENACEGCPYDTHNNESCGISDDILALLKEQEAVEPKKTAYQRVDHIIAYRYRCGTCDMNIFPSYKYCPFCGQAVKWE